MTFFFFLFTILWIVLDWSLDTLLFVLSYEVRRYPTLDDLEMFFE